MSDLFQVFDLNSTELEKTSLIEASAGTGKTFNISGIYLKLILEKRFTVNQILVVTFTEAATSELKDRIRKRLMELHLDLDTDPEQIQDDFHKSLVLNSKNKEVDKKRIKNAIRIFDEAQIFTIHGFCRKILIENAFESKMSFNSDIESDEAPLIKELIFDFIRKRLINKDYELVKDVKNNNIGPHTFREISRQEIHNPRVKRIPDNKNVEYKEITNIKNSLKEIFKELKILFENESENIKNLILKAGLHGAKYSKAKVEKYYIELNSFFNLNTEKCLYNIPSKLIKFTNEELNKAVTKKSEYIPEHTFFNKVDIFMDKYNEYKHYLDSFFKKLEREFISFLKKELDNKKKTRNILTFNDIIYSVWQILNERSEQLSYSIKNKYKAALVDEFQDTDIVQYEIFRDIFFKDKEKISFMIGDPKQSIYGFRGADIFSYIEAKEDADNKYTLKRNFRSEKNFIHSVNYIFDVERPFYNKDLGFIPVEYPEKDKKDQDLYKENNNECSIEIKYIHEDSVLDFGFDVNKKGYINKDVYRTICAYNVARDISELLKKSKEQEVYIQSGENKNRIKPDDIAVIVRTHKEGELVKRFLTGISIPSVVYSKNNIFLSEECASLIFILKAVERYNEISILKKALSSALINKKIEYLKKLDDQDEQLNIYLDMFSKYKNIFEEKGFVYMINILIEDLEIRENILNGENRDRRITNLLHLIELIQKEFFSKKMSISDIIKWLQQERLDENNSSEKELRLESDDKAVSIVTIHACKGLQYPVVFFLSAGSNTYIGRGDNAVKFHKDGKVYIDSGSDQYSENRKIFIEETLSEDIRLFYVALTRAEHKCFLYWGPANGAEYSPANYLFHNARYNINDIESIKMKSPDEMIEDIRSLSKGCKYIDVDIIEKKKELIEYSEEDEQIEIQFKDFNKKIDNSFKKTSFSGLIKGISHEKIRFDEEDLEYELDSSEKNIFTFPKGPEVGTMIHEMFEIIDFTWTKEEKIEKISNILTENNFLEEWHLKTIYNMFNNVLNTSLSKEKKDFKLCNIPIEDRISELKFDMRVYKNTSWDIQKILTKNKKELYDPEISEHIKNLDFSEYEGFMTGFIDMVFRYNGKYYILDWKSNLLGNNYRSYSAENIKKVMRSNFYYLQYYIYNVAFHKYLQNRIKDYHYNRDFGGVFYLFVRGMKKDENTGVFYDRISQSLLLDLCEELTEQKNINTKNTLF